MIIDEKFVVFKIEDAEKYLNMGEHNKIVELLGKIAQGRIQDGKKANNQYLVINTDEPYAESVFEVIQYTEKTGNEFGGIEIRSKKQQEAHEYLSNYNTDANFFDEEYR